MVCCKNIFKNDTLEFSQDFFTNGFNSLKATAMLSRIHQMGYPITIETLFTKPSVAALSEYLKNKELVSVPEIEIAKTTGNYPLTAGQRRFWILHQFNQNTASHINNLSIIKGNFNPLAFIKAIKTIVSRHDSLRTVFRTKSGEVYQEVIPVDVLILKFRYWISVQNKIREYWQNLMLRILPVLVLICHLGHCCE